MQLKLIISEKELKIALKKTLLKLKQYSPFSNLTIVSTDNTKSGESIVYFKQGFNMPVEIQKYQVEEFLRMFESFLFEDEILSIKKFNLSYSFRIIQDRIIVTFSCPDTDLYIKK